MTRKPLAELLTGQPGLPNVEGTIDAVLRDADGNILQQPPARAEQLRQLIEEFGISEELVMALPEDSPIPPPPAR